MTLGHAGVVSVNLRTAQKQREHEIAAEMVAEFKAQQAQKHRESVRCIAETTAYLKGVDDFLARRGR